MADPLRRRLLQLAALAPTLAAAPRASAFSLFDGQGDGRWPLWMDFADGFIQQDGRVIDWTDGGRTVSEGQAYAMFFALVANDRGAFDRILAWTQRNLAGGDLKSQLPAWLWGEDTENNRWGVLDTNPASDADLFIAYALFEAARLWQAPEFGTIAEAMLALIRERETLRRYGQTLLLPAPDGFSDEAGIRLNPSYIVPFQMRYFAERDPDGLWQAILDDFVRASADFLPLGLPPDWMLLGPDGYQPDNQTGTRGSFDAVRCFLWSALRVPGLDSVAPLRERLARAAPALRAHRAMPESWDVATGTLHGEGPPGFQLCAATWFGGLGFEADAERLAARAQATRNGGLYGEPARYYDQVLALFATGWTTQRFRFAADGRLIPQWTSA